MVGLSTEALVPVCASVPVPGCVAILSICMVSVVGWASVLSTSGAAVIPCSTVSSDAVWPVGTGCGSCSTHMAKQRQSSNSARSRSSRCMNSLHTFWTVLP